MDDSDQSMGWKAAQYEMKGVPLRVEIGPKDMEKNQCCICRRDSGEKVFVSLDELEITVSQLLDAVHDGLYQRAKKNLEDHTKVCMTLDEVKEFMESEGGFAKTMWCGDLECELKMKEQAGVSSRCMPLQQEHVSDVCVCCGKPAKHSILWGCGLLSRLTGKTEKPSGICSVHFIPDGFFLSFLIVTFQRKVV